MKKHTKQNIGVKLSTSFLRRTKCKYCSDYDPVVYRIRNFSLDYDVKISIRKIDYIKDYVKRMCDDFYLEFNPKIFHDTSLFKHAVPYKGYNPRLHRLKNVQHKFHFTEFITCKCGQTNWAVNYKSCEKQLSSNRKTNVIYPDKFYY